MRSVPRGIAGSAATATRVPLTGRRSRCRRAASTVSSGACAGRCPPIPLRGFGRGVVADIDLDAVQREIRMYLASDWVGANRVSIAVSLAEQMPALVEEVQRLRADLAKTDELARQAISAEARAVRELEHELEQERRAAARLRDERDRLRDELASALNAVHYQGPRIGVQDGVYERVSEQTGSPVPDHVDGHPAGHRQTGESR